MRKLLLLAGIFTVLAYNAQARYYEENGYYYEEQPRYERQVRYRDEPRYTRQEPARYRRVNASEARRYEERRAYRENYTETKIRPYVGLDVATSSLKFEDTDDKDFFKDSNNSIGVVLGAKFNKNFGLEAFYQKSGKAEKEFEGWDYEGETELSYAAYGVDAIGYMPLNQDFELLASLGVAQYNFKAKAKGYYDDYEYYSYDDYYDEEEDSENKKFDSLGIRIGLGAQYNINRHWALRAMARYVKMNDDDYIKSLTEFSLGLRYMF